MISIVIYNSKNFNNDDNIKIFIKKQDKKEKYLIYSIDIILTKQNMTKYGFIGLFFKNKKHAYEWALLANRQDIAKKLKYKSVSFGKVYTKIFNKELELKLFMLKQQHKNDLFEHEKLFFQPRRIC